MACFPVISWRYLLSLIKQKYKSSDKKFHKSILVFYLNLVEKRNFTFEGKIYKPSKSFKKYIFMHWITCECLSTSHAKFVQDAVMDWMMWQYIFSNLLKNNRNPWNIQAERPQGSGSTWTWKSSLLYWKQKVHGYWIKKEHGFIFLNWHSYTFQLSCKILWCCRIHISFFISLTISSFLRGFFSRNSLFFLAS